MCVCVCIQTLAVIQIFRHRTLFVFLCVCGESGYFSAVVKPSQNKKEKDCKRVFQWKGVRGPCIYIYIYIVWSFVIWAAFNISSLAQEQEKDLQGFTVFLFSLFFPIFSLAGRNKVQNFVTPTKAVGFFVYIILVTLYEELRPAKILSAYLYNTCTFVVVVVTIDLSLSFLLLFFSSHFLSHLVCLQTLKKDRENLEKKKAEHQRFSICSFFSFKLYIEKENQSQLCTFIWFLNDWLMQFNILVWPSYSVWCFYSISPWTETVLNFYYSDFCTLSLSFLKILSSFVKIKVTRSSLKILSFFFF